MLELVYEFENGYDDLEIYNRSVAIMNRLYNEGVFSGKIDRHMLAHMAHLIRYNNEDIGFIYLVNESRLDKMNDKLVLFIDMGLIYKYRNKGIGKEVLKRYIDLYGNEVYLIGEVKKENIASNKICQKLGHMIPDEGKNYYIFGDMKEFDFQLFEEKVQKHQNLLLENTINNQKVKKR